jgi:hypothetical protein
MKGFLWILIFFPFLLKAFPNNPEDPYVTSLKRCMNSAPLEMIRNAARYVLNYVNLPTREKEGFLRAASGDRKILYTVKDQTNDIPVYDIYAIGLSKREYFFGMLCRNNNLEMIKTTISNDLKKLTEKVINSDLNSALRNCRVKKILVKKMKFPPQGILPTNLTPKDFFNKKEWQDFSSNPSQFLKVVHTLRLKNLLPTWVDEKFNNKFLISQPNYRDIQKPKKLSVSLVSNYYPYPVRGSFLGFSLQVELPNLVATGVTDLNSNQFNTYEEIARKSSQENFKIFKSIFPYQQVSESSDWSILNPKLVALLTRGKWNEIVLKGNSPVDSYIMYDVNDPKMIEARFGMLEATNWNKTHDNLIHALRRMSEGCRRLNIPVEYIEIVE